MIFRRMHATDLAAVAQIDQLSFSQPWPPAAFEVELENPISRCWVAVLENTETENIVAALVLWRVLDEAHIATIAVHPAHRRQGIGQKILKIAMDEACTEGARYFHLEVRAGNLSAQNLYAGFGYQIVGRRPKYYKDNGEDAVLMTCDTQNQQSAA
jgi:ribosomal-protein-alanine N-acetyltransferase